jgi:NADPH:quinone reductase-like Zn-dependent oxidoreductase
VAGRFRSIRGPAAAQLHRQRRPRDTLEDSAAEAVVWAELVELDTAATITTPVGAVYDFEDVPRMVAEQAAPGPGPGKTVVEVSGQPS